MPILHQGFLAFFNAIASIGYVNIATYVNKVRQDECACAKDWRQEFLFIFSVVFAAISLAYVFVVATGTYDALIRRYPYINMILTVCTAAYILISYAYTQNMKKIGCTCSKEAQVILIYIIHFLNGLLVTYGIILMSMFFAVGGAAVWYATKK